MRVRCVLHQAESTHLHSAAEGSAQRVDHSQRTASGRSEIELLVRIATGDVVTPGEAQGLLYSRAGRVDRDRCERLARIRLRDRSLAEAARVLDFDSCGAWVLAKRLEDAVKRFETRLWPLLRNGIHQRELSPSEAALHRAFLTGERVPKTARRLYDLLK